MSAKVGPNSEIFPDILKLYVPKNSVVVDPNYARGVFWRKVPKDYYLMGTDLQREGVDMRNLPYKDEIADAFVMDPPYVVSSRNKEREDYHKYYNLGILNSMEDVEKLYAHGIKEADRVLKKGGTLIIKCMDINFDGSQHWYHIDIAEFAESLGYKLLDIFVVVLNHLPIIRQKNQKHAKKNHSYFLVLRKPIREFKKRENNISKHVVVAEDECGHCGAEIPYRAYACPGCGVTEYIDDEPEETGEGESR